MAMFRPTIQRFTVGSMMAVRVGKDQLKALHAYSACDVRLSLATYACHHSDSQRYLMPYLNLT